MNKEPMGARLSNWAMQAVIGHRWLWLLLLALALIPAGIGLSRLEMDTSNESFMPENDPVTLANEAFKDQYGNTEFLFVLVEADNIYTYDTLVRIDALVSAIEAHLPFANQVTAITTTEYLDIDGDMLRSKPLTLDGLPRTANELDEFRRKIESSPLISDRLITADGRFTGIAIGVQQVPEVFYARVADGYSPMNARYQNMDLAVLTQDISLTTPAGSTNNGALPDGWMRFYDHRKIMSATILALLQEHQDTGFALRVTGMPMIDYQIDDFTEQEAGLFGLLGAVVAIVLLTLLYRSPRAVAAPMLVFLLTVIYVFGFSSLLGIRFSIVSIIIAPVILVISVSYSVHVINHIRAGLKQGHTHINAIRNAYTAVAWPCLLTALTTAIGFASFLFAPMQPMRMLGLQCAAGALTGFVLVMTLLPILFLPGRRQTAVATEHTATDSNATAADSSATDKSATTASARVQRTPGVTWKRLNTFLHRRSVAIATVAVLLMLFSILGMFQIRTSSDMLTILGKNVPFVEDTLFISERLGGAYSAEFLITLPEPEMARQPDVLKAVYKAGQTARERPDITMDLSLADLVIELDRVLGSGEAQIPDSSQAIAQYLLLYEMSGGELLDEWTDYEYRTLRLSLMFGAGTDGIHEVQADTTAYLREHLPEGSTVVMAGDMPVMLRMMELLIDGQIISTLAALGTIALLLILVLQSLRLGLLAVIPNIFPIVTTLGIMGWLNLPLDMVTALISPMLIGIAVDDTIHFFVRYATLRPHTSQAQEATERTLRDIGNALMFTSIVLIGGFSLFGFSRMASLQNVGILTAAGVASAFLADIFLAPLLVSIKEKV